jgi:CheY-like chemotaxis protein
VSPPTIVIAEDHPMFRGALALTLRRLMPEAVLIEVASHGELEKALAVSSAVKMVLLDLRMPGANGLSSLVFLRGTIPNFRSQLFLVVYTPKPSTAHVSWVPQRSSLNPRRSRPSRRPCRARGCGTDGRATLRPECHGRLYSHWVSAPR